MRAARALYAATLAGSALLIFWVQPYFAKALLPHFGGAAGVWLVALVFFQAALLAGYVYAHLSRRYLKIRSQALLHGGLLLVGALFLPPALSAGFAPDPHSWPALPLLTALILHLGLPFAVLAGTAPLLQHWFAASNDPQADNPYILYAASNAGSLAALLAYPLWLEPSFTLSQQALLWSVAYAAVFAGIVATGLRLRTNMGTPPVQPMTQDMAAGIWWERAFWIILAAAPTALLAAVTTHLTTDVAAFPMLWIAPLALYLLTYIAAFMGFPRNIRPLRFVAPALLALLVVALWFERESFFWALATHLLAFGGLALLCHRQLYEARPHPARLTEFYLLIALGGVTGTAVTAFLPPLLFSTPLEYPLLLAAACLLMPERIRGVITSRKGAMQLAYTLGATATGILIIAILPDPGTLSTLSMNIVFAAIVGVVGICFLLLARFPLLLAGVFLAAWFSGPNTGSGNDTSGTIWSGRSFFGSYHITADQTKGGFYLYSGTTIHGFEGQDRSREKPEPATYYHPHGPLGQIMQGMGSRFTNIGILGLGIGNSACHAREGQNWTFYEIDPLVTEIARDSRFFRSLSACAPAARIVTGDGRLSLAAEPPEHFDLLAMDAFTSNSVPIHLLTREAFIHYARVLKTDGVILVHVSNRHLNLAPVTVRTAAEAGFAALEQDFMPGRSSRGDGMVVYSSHWVALSRDENTLAAIAATGDWKSATPRESAPLWTDDHAALFGALY